MPRRGRGRRDAGAPAARRVAPGARLRPGRGRRGDGPGAVANAEAGQQYNPEVRSLRQQAKGSRARERDLGQWYKRLAADYQGAQNAGTSALQSLEETTSKQLAEANSTSSADQARLAAQDEQFAKLVGGPRDASGLSKIAQAGAAAARSRVALTQPVEAEQANFIGRLGSDKAAARMQGIESTKEERDRRGKILSDLAGVRKEKGAAQVVNKAKALEAKQAAAAERAELALKSREAASDERQAAADAALARLKAGQETRQDAIANRQAQERIGISRRNAKTSERSQKASARGAKGMTPTQRREAHREAKSAYVTAQNLYKAASKPPRNEKTWASFIQLVASEEGIDPVAAQKAVERLRKQLAAQRRSAYDRRFRGPSGAPH